MPRTIDADKLGLTDFEIVLCRGDYKEALKMLIEKIQNAPIVDAEPVRHGHWMEARYPLFTCSECGATYQDTGYGYNYCPNCGAKMDGEKGDEKTY